MLKHTPGPWKWVVEYEDKNYKLIQKDFESSDNSEDGEVRLITEAPVEFSGVANAWCDRSGDYKGIEIDIADARLIAAAPELLKELQWMRKLWQKEKNNHVGLINANGAEVFEWIDRVDAAITKAIGETK